MNKPSNCVLLPLLVTLCLASVATFSAGQDPEPAPSGQPAAVENPYSRPPGGGAEPAGDGVAAGGTHGGDAAGDVLRRLERVEREIAGLRAELHAMAGTAAVPGGKATVPQEFGGTFGAPIPVFGWERSVAAALQRRYVRVSPSPYASFQKDYTGPNGEAYSVIVDQIGNASRAVTRRYALPRSVGAKLAELLSDPSVAIDAVALGSGGVQVTATEDVHASIGPFMLMLQRAGAPK